MGRKSNNLFQIHFGKKFYKQTSGYFVLREWDKIHKIYYTILAHRWVWENEIGQIPIGKEVHHKDKDKSNNTKENLELVTRSEHQQIHAQELSQKKHLDKVRPIAWLKSVEGKLCVSEKGKEIWANREETEITCEGCGHKASFKRWARFCSKNCYMKWCHRNKINFIEFICDKCGKVSMKPKSKKTRFCSLSCAKNKSV